MLYKVDYQEYKKKKTSCKVYLFTLYYTKVLFLGESEMTEDIKIRTLKDLPMKDKIKNDKENYKY